ncbi:ScbA/BarX family gamma-butyrolactone biosynthesis protein [Streptomyces sp. URMC 123]|uniref:ScbA/BarX family gamma-butyrolactone biosynthesis protein n=1 Tax=Streptomyces sp. URMC 123 TaxID=3423403 RepID=UPI003F19A25D
MAVALLELEPGLDRELGRGPLRERGPEREARLVRQGPLQGARQGSYEGLHGGSYEDSQGGAYGGVRQALGGESAAGCPLDDGCAFDRTVPRRLVHRSAVSEVLLTRWRALGDNTFEIAAQWPRGHSFYTPMGHRAHDPMLVAETLRQAGLLIAHAEFGVPLGHQFLMWGLTYEMTEEGLRLDGTPAAVTARATCHDIKTRGRSLAGLRLAVELHRDGVLVGRGETSFHCVSPSAYARLRPIDLDRAWATAEAPLPEPVEPGLVGRDRAQDVVLAPTGEGNAWSLRVDRRHPVLFDHPVDHVPGMAVMEGMRQAARLAMGSAPAMPVGFSADFARYVEFGSPCTVVAEVEGPAEGGGSVVRARVVQDGVTAASGRLVMLPVAV